MTALQNDVEGRSHPQPRGADPKSPLQKWHQDGVHMLTRSKLYAVVVCSLVFSICPLLYSQANGSFSGTIVDKTGSVISGAAVKITSQATGLVRDAKTDDT